MFRNVYKELPPVERRCLLLSGGTFRSRLYIHWHSICVILVYCSGSKWDLRPFLDVTQRGLGVSDVSGQPSCLGGSSSSRRIQCASLLLPFVCLFLLVNNKQLTCSWHHVRWYATDHNMPPAVTEDEKGETEPVFFFCLLFGDWLLTVELEPGIWSESCRKWDCTKDGGLHPHVNECQLAAGWIPLQFDWTHHEAKSWAVERLWAECGKLARRLWYPDGFVLGALPIRCVSEHVN